MYFQLALFSPAVGRVVVIHIAKEETFAGLMDNYPEVTTDPHRPEVFVFCIVELVELHARIGRVQLQVKGRSLHGLLFFAGQFGEAVGKCISYTELHRATYPDASLASCTTSTMSG